MNKLFELVITAAAVVGVIYVVWCLVEIATNPGAFPQ
jgi:hypothetical protein